MMRLLARICFSAALTTSAASPAIAEATYGSFTVHQLISEPSTAGFTSVEGFPMCQYGIMYIDTATEAGKVQFAMVVSAKASGWKITGVVFSIAAGGECRVQSLYGQ